MNKISVKGVLSEIISLVKRQQIKENGVLSQKHKAVTPNCSNWLFYCPKCVNALAIPPYFKHNTAQSGWVRFPLMVWLILQNKPFGEYVKRFLYVPRVRPHQPITGFLLKNHKGAFQC